MTMRCVMAPAPPPAARRLAEAIRSAPYVAPARYLFQTAGVLICKVASRESSHYHLVVSDRATADCERGIDLVFRAEGIPQWRKAIVETEHAPRANSHFLGSTHSTLYIIHPEVTP